MRTSASGETAGHQSLPLPFTAGPRLNGAVHASERVARDVTQISRRPDPPGRSEEKNSVRPSRDNFGTPSVNGLLMTGPRFCGSFQLLEGVVLRAYQMSPLPWPPGRTRRPLSKNSPRPSAEILGDAAEWLFTVRPTLTAVR